VSHDHCDCVEGLEEHIAWQRDRLAEQDARGLRLAAEADRLRTDAEAWTWLMDNLPEGFDGDGAVEALIAERLAEAEGLRAALNRAGDRLAQVQPGVTEPWAFDIVPKAEREIAAALADQPTENIQPQGEPDAAIWHPEEGWVAQGLDSTMQGPSRHDLRDPPEEVTPIQTDP
jgi:hypothetical protein